MTAVASRKQQVDGQVDAGALARELAGSVDGEVRFDSGTRAAYSTDASNFRQVPLGVVLPRNPDAGAEAIAVAREFGAPVLSRGGGTSLAEIETQEKKGYRTTLEAMHPLDPDWRLPIDCGVFTPALMRRLVW